MNIILLTAIIVTLAPVCGGQSVFDGNITDWSDFSDQTSLHLQPCQRGNSIGSYNTFVHRHILQEYFDRNSKHQWKSYLHRKGLCGRTLVQTFIDAGVGAVQQICSWSGRRLWGHSGNLCISKSCMQLYDVRSSHNCRCIRVQKYKKKVIVACDKVYNQCLPVHFERNRGQRSSNRPCA